MSQRVAYNTNTQYVFVKLVSSTDHITVSTGVTGPTITLCKQGGTSFGAISDGTWAEIGNGVYSIRLNSTDSGTGGQMIVQVVKAGSDTAHLEVYVEASVAQTGDAYAYLGTNMGLLGASMRVILNSTQSDYAPSKAGDAMTLTSTYDAAKTAAAAGAQMDLVNDPNATVLAAISANLIATTSFKTLLSVARGKVVQSVAGTFDFYSADSTAYMFTNTYTTAQRTSS